MNVAVKLKKKKSKKASKAENIPNPIDENYESLNCDINPIEKGSKEYKLLEEYLENTANGRKLAIVDVFKVKR